MGKLLEIFKFPIPNLKSSAGLSSAPALGRNWIFWVLGAVIISIFSLSIGRTRAVISLLSLYVALVFELIFPYWQATDSITLNLEIHWLRAGLFIGAYILTFIIFNLSFIKKRVSSGEFSLPTIILFNFLQVGLMLSIILNILPKEVAIKLLSGFSLYFASQQALFIWAVAPLPFLFFIARK